MHQHEQPHTQRLQEPQLLLQPPVFSVVESTVQKQREEGIAHALNVISQSMEPPPHFLDEYRERLLKYLEELRNPDRWYWRCLRHLLNVPFFRLRTFWHYIIMPSPLFYNLALLLSLYFTTPPLIAFVVGVGLFWCKIVYELYRDIMHRDDIPYNSNVAKELSLLAACSAAIAVAMKMKADIGRMTLDFLPALFGVSSFNETPSR